MASEAGYDLKKEREKFLLLAQIAMQGKDYRCVMDVMKKLIELVMPTDDLSKEERNCFSSACEFFIHGQIVVWRHMAFVLVDVSCDNGCQESVIENQELIADEISETCAEIVGFIDRSILCAGDGAAKRMTTECMVFYKMMKGEYLGHVAMVKNGVERKKAVEDVLDAYNAAVDEALELPETDQTRLKLALKLAVFHAEINESLDKACYVAKKAVDMAKRSFEIREKLISSEITGVLNELENNIKIWTAKIKGQEDLSASGPNNLSHFDCFYPLSIDHLTSDISSDTDSYNDSGSGSDSDSDIEEALELQMDQTRLKLALKLAVFHAETYGSLNKACYVAKEAVDIAKRSFEIRREIIPSKINGVLEELENNIKIWTAKIEDGVTSQN